MNFTYFGIEFGIALAIKSVSLFADSIDFLEDTFLNLLIFIALGRSIQHRELVGMLLSGVLLIPGLTTLWSAWEKPHLPLAPDLILLSLTGFGVLVRILQLRFHARAFSDSRQQHGKGGFLFST